MSAAAAEQTSLTGARRWTIIGTTLVAAFVFSLNARGCVLESPVIVQAFALDRYKVQWITGAEAVAGLTTLFAGIYLIKLVGARRAYLLGAACLTAGCLGEALARTPWELGVAGAVCGSRGVLSGSGRCTPDRRRDPR